MCIFQRTSMSPNGHTNKSPGPNEGRGFSSFEYKMWEVHGPEQSMPGKGTDYLLRFMRLWAHLSLSANVSIIIKFVIMITPQTYGLF